MRLGIGFNEIIGHWLTIQVNGNREPTILRLHICFDHFYYLVNVLN